MGLTKRVKARAARSLALTRLFKSALKSEQRAVCRGLSRMAQPPRSGATKWHPLQFTTDTQQSIQHFGRHSRHQSASKASLLGSSGANLWGRSQLSLTRVWNLGDQTIAHGRFPPPRQRGRWPRSGRRGPLYQQTPPQVRCAHQLPRLRGSKSAFARSGCVRAPEPPHQLGVKRVRWW
ncbi:MAG: hypothetical protein RL186_443 [Pseudomonadota bacterium]|jgi:hypothetical protein